MKHVATVTLLTFGLMLQACINQKHYKKADYSFYDKAHVKADSSFLRTDGVYVLDNIVTDETRHSSGDTKVTDIFKFYDNGQVNKVLVTNGKPQKSDEYVAAFNERIAKRVRGQNATLFEGYYKQRTDSIVIQQVSAPRRQFYYTYGYIKHGSLIIVSQTHATSGRILAKYYATKYKAFYRFVATGKEGYLAPDW